jgi:hypothetical protein
MKDEDDLRELNQLLQQYAEATIEERERLSPDLGRAINKVAPGLLERADTRFFNGDYLKDMFDQCMERVLARPDLSPDRKTNAIEDAAVFTACFDLAKRWQVPKLAAHAFEMATRALFTGLRAGLSPVEIEDLRARFFSERQRSVAEKGGENRRDKEWRKFAKDEALRLHKANRLLTLTDIARKIENAWETEDFEKVEFQQLFKYLSTLVDNGELPSAMKRSSRKRDTQGSSGANEL